MLLPRRSAALLAATAAIVLTIDLSTKLVAVHDPSFFGDGLIYNPQSPHSVVRLTVCVTTIVVIAVIASYAERRDAGSVPFVWIAGGLLLGGVLGNWSSEFIWAPGVPDFIARGDRMWNLADFAIGMGMLLFLLSTVGYAFRTYLHGRHATAAASRTDAARAAISSTNDLTCTDDPSA